MPSSKIRTTATAVAIAAALLAGSACHSSPKASTSGVALTAVQLAADKTTKAGSSKVAITASVTAGGTTNLHLSETGGGVVDFEHGNASIRVSLVGAGVTGALELRIVERVLYEKLPPGAVQGAKPWLKVDLSKFTSAQLGVSSNAFTGDPTQTLDYLKGVSSAVADLGAGTVRGVKAEHYRFTVDLRKAADRIPEAERKEFLSELQSFGSTSMPMDLWIDDQGRARRMSFSPDMRFGAQEVKLQETVDLYDFGVPVKVSPPPSSEVTDVTGLTK